MSLSASKTLLIDAGNSRFKWALAQDSSLTENGSALYQQDALSQQLQECWASFTQADKCPQRVLLCNVAAPRFAEAVMQWAASFPCRGGVLPVVETVLAQARAFGVTNAYVYPERLGADRWAALVAARRYIEGAACVVDVGTALTVDVLSAEGVHRGGIIVPGMKLMKQSLIDNTAAIAADDRAAAATLGNDTPSAVQAGVLAAAAGAVTQVMQAARAELGTELTVVVTGGDALPLLAVLPAELRHEPDWVLRGLAVIAEAEQ